MSEGVRIIGMMVVGPGEGDRWLEPVLEQRSKLVDDMVIVGNNTDEKTEKIIKASGAWFYRDDREWGVHQPKIKSELLTRVAKLRPDWILPSDSDELYDKNFTREAAEELASWGHLAYEFYVVNLWNDENHYRHDLSFHNIRYFRYAPELGLQFEQKNVHCGLAPAVCYRYASHCPYILKHFGLMLPEARAEKVARYEKYDPKGIFKPQSWYNQLKNDNNVRPFNEDDFHARAVRDFETHFKGKEDKKKYERIPTNGRR